MIRYIIHIVCFILFSIPLFSQVQSGSKIKLARVKYSGGGDWYNDQSAEVNLLKYVNAHTTIQTEPVYEYVDLSTDNIFLYPLLFLTGHGTMSLSDTEAKRLRTYLENGGFL